MFKRNVWLGLTLLLVALLVIGAFPAHSRAQEGSTGEPNFIFINYLGQELTLDVDDTTYTVPGVTTNPEGGRLALSLAPGEHKYAANAAGVPTGSAGTFEIMAGDVVGKAARLDETGPSLDRQGNVLAKPEEFVDVFDIDPFATPTAPAPVTDAWQPVQAPAGQGSLVWINYTGDELTVDLNGQVYTVPPQANGIPGRLQTNVAPDFYRYTASIPYGAVSGEVDVTAGEVIGLTVSAEPQPEPEYDIGEPVEIPPVELRLNQEDLTDQARISAEGATAMPDEMMEPATPSPATVETPQAMDMTGAEGLLITNYTGDTVIFTIAGEQHFIPADTEKNIELPPGQYNYTASLPYVATTGAVDLATGDTVSLSLATTIGGDALNVYKN